MTAALPSLPRISVVINNYNYGDFVDEAIESVLQQEYPALELIVVDDGSTDHSRDIIASYGDKIIPLYQPNTGQSSALNNGVSRSTGDIICTLDADDLFSPGKLQTLATLFQEQLSLEKPVLGSHFLQVVDIERNLLPGTLPAFFKNIHLKKLASPPLLQRLTTPAEALVFVEKYAIPPFLGSASSGLFFTRTLADKLFPLPIVPHAKTTADGFIIRGGMLVAESFCYQAVLGLYRVHGKNAWYSKSRGNTRVHKDNLSFYEPWLNRVLDNLGLELRVDFEASLDAMWYYIHIRDVRSLMAISLRFLKRDLNIRNSLSALYSIATAFRITLGDPLVWCRKKKVP